MKFKILLFLCLTTFGALAQQGKFTIQGKFLNNVKATQVYVTRTRMVANEPKTFPVKIINNQFSLSGMLDEPEQCLLSWKEKPTEKEDSFTFILDKGIAIITLTNTLKSATVKGSKANTDLAAYYKTESANNVQLNQFYQKAQAASQKSSNIDSVRAVFEPQYQALQKISLNNKYNFISQNPDAFVSLLLVIETAQNSLNYVRADSLFNSLSPSIKLTPSGKQISDQIASEKQFSIGAQAPEFTSLDSNSKPISLSSLRGKFVLLDFWASWCGPCRQENPNVVHAYNTYKDKGFTVLGVSLDQDRTNWIKAIKSDNLTWNHVSDLKYWQNEVARVYNIRAIPRNFLLDPTGKIVARDLRGEELNAKLKMLLQ